jgi:ribosomal protein L11 methyltransferase
MNEAYIALEFSADLQHVDALQGFFLMNSELGGVQENDDGTVTFFIPVSEWNPRLEDSLTEFCSQNEGIEFLGSEKIEDRDWNAEWEASIGVQWITGELVITPSWRIDEAKALSPKYLIVIDPKMSFGTGHHETTRLCLRAIETIEMDGKTLLDIGTGTGILAIYSLQRGAMNAIGVDTDSWSIENSIANRSLNNIPESRLEIRKGTIEIAIDSEEKFDVILANIHRNVLIEMASQIRSHLIINGMLILAGILIYDSEEVRAAYEALGFNLIRETQENEWACLTLQLVSHPVSK